LVAKVPWPGQKAVAAGGSAAMAAAMRSSASSQPAGRRVPPRASRSSGCVRRSGLPMISRLACPRMHRKPRLSGLAGSPRTASSASLRTSASMPHRVGWQFIGHIVRTVRTAPGAGVAVPRSAAPSAALLAALLAAMLTALLAARTPDGLIEPD